MNEFDFGLKVPERTGLGPFRLHSGSVPNTHLLRELALLLFLTDLYVEYHNFSARFTELVDTIAEA